MTTIREIARFLRGTGFARQLGLQMTWIEIANLFEISSRLDYVFCFSHSLVAVNERSIHPFSFSVAGRLCFSRLRAYPFFSTRNSV